jgi:hypothetical protein
MPTPLPERANPTGAVDPLSKTGLALDRGRFDKDLALLSNFPT